MVTFVADLILGGLLSLALFVLGLFPSINPDDFVFSAPEGVREALGALNWFVPVSDLMDIFGVWLALVLVANAVALFAKFTEQGQNFMK